jgi:UDP:flavonoid glycosyltransferase YjiC (YdhE family)
MSKILMPVTQLAEHVNPMLAIAEYLQQHGHEVIFNTAELF